MPAPDTPDAPAKQSNPNPGTSIVYLPEQPPGPVIPVLKKRFSISLFKDESGSTSTGVVLMGQLQQYMVGLVPIPNNQVTLFKLVQNTCLNKPSEWSPYAVATTDPEGVFRFHVLPLLEEDVIYAAALGSTQDDVLASSDYISIIYPTYAGGNPMVLGQDQVPNIPFADLNQA